MKTVIIDGKPYKPLDVGHGTFEQMVLHLDGRRYVLYPQEYIPQVSDKGTAREMIEAKIADVEKSMESYVPNTEAQWNAGELYGLRSAIECLDKPAEPMVSVEQVIDKLVASWDDEYQQYMIGPVMAWLNEKSGK